MKKIIACFIFLGSSVHAADNTLKITEFKRADSYKVDMDGYLYPHPEVDITLSCRKNGYRAHKIDDIEINPKGQTVYHHNNFSLGRQFRSHAISRCIQTNRWEHNVDYSMPFEVKAQCIKVKNPNKGRIDFLTLESSYAIGRVDCTDAIANIFRNLHEEVLTLDDEHPMKDGYLHRIERDQQAKEEQEERKRARVLEGISEEAKKIKIRKVEPVSPIDPTDN